jgi:hypothetical protein
MNCGKMESSDWNANTVCSAKSMYEMRSPVVMTPAKIIWPPYQSASRMHASDAIDETAPRPPEIQARFFATKYDTLILSE